jgi:integrase/recombinase XerC
VVQRIDTPSLWSAIDRACRELSPLALSPQTARAMSKAWHRLGRYTTSAVGAQATDDLSVEVVTRFVYARHGDGSEPSVAAMHWRRSAVRLLFRIWRDIGLAGGDPTLDLWLPARASMSCRPLSDDDVALCRWASLSNAGETRLAVVWALAEAGATTGEIPFVRARDVDANRQSVWLGGTAKSAPRTAALTEWGATQIGRRLARAAVDPSAFIAYGGTAGPASGQASVSGAIGDILRRAGLHGEQGVKPRSVTAWAGQRIFDETGRIDAVARQLGLRSLDRAATLIGWDWRAA